MKSPTSNYRMSRAAKYYLAFNWDRPLRNLRKKTIIEGELCASESSKNKVRQGADTAQ